MTFLTLETCERASVLRELAEMADVQLGLGHLRARAGDIIWFHMLGKNDPASFATIYCIPDCTLYRIVTNGIYHAGVVDNWHELLQIIKEHFRPMTDEEEWIYADHWLG